MCWSNRMPFKVEHLETFWHLAILKRIRIMVWIGGEALPHGRECISVPPVFFFSFFFLFTQGPGDYFYRLGDVVLAQRPTPKNRKPEFLWKSKRWKQIAPRENNILAGTLSGGQLDPNASMIYHFLYLHLCVWGCCVQHNDPWLKIELRPWEGSGASLIRSPHLRTQQDHLNSVAGWFATLT